MTARRRGRPVGTSRRPAAIPQLRAWRVGRGISCATLARMITDLPDVGVPTASRTVGAWEESGTPPSEARLTALAILIGEPEDTIAAWFGVGLAAAVEESSHAS